MPYVSWCFTKWTSTITFARNYFHYHFQNNVTNPNSNEYKLTAIVLDIAGHRLFIPVGIKKDEIDKRSFLKLLFANKGLDGINLGNILHQKSVISKISPYFKDQSLPIISYVYSRSIASNKCNCKHVLHDLNIADFKSKPPDCICAVPRSHIIRLPTL